LEKSRFFDGRDGMAEHLQGEALKSLKNWEFGDSFHHAGWPQVVGAVIEAKKLMRLHAGSI